MKPTHSCWYFAALAVAFVVPGLRVLTWPAPRVHVVAATDVEVGKKLFTHEWKPNDPLANGGDGLGPVFNAASCVACHGEPSLGGASGMAHNVTMFTLLPLTPTGQTQQGVVHANAVKPDYLETLNKVHPDLPKDSRPKLTRFDASRTGVAVGFDFTVPSNVVLSQRNTPALYGAKWIDELSDRDIIAVEREQQLRWGLATARNETLPVGRALRGPDGRVGRFGWKAQSASLLEFVQAACANELGLGNPAQAQPNPIGRPNYKAKGLDLTDQQCQQMTAFLVALPRPIERLPADPKARVAAQAGRTLFTTVSCADCHTPNVGSVEGIYSDLLMHRMGPDLMGGGFYYGSPLPNIAASSLPQADEWRTPPLWGVADSAPYMHDGRAETLEEAITMHGGQGARAAAAFGRLSQAEKGQLIAFLKALRAP
jgi:CxxC motif-containing protein (DUF1111 family)